MKPMRNHKESIGTIEKIKGLLDAEIEMSKGESKELRYNRAKKNLEYYEDTQKQPFENYEYEELVRYITKKIGF